MPRITDFCICVYVLGCKLSLVRLCDGDFVITPVDDITIRITCVAFRFHLLLLLLLLLLSSSSSSSSNFSLLSFGWEIFTYYYYYYYSFQTPVTTYQTTRRHMPEDHRLHIYYPFNNRRTNTKSMRSSAFGEHTNAYRIFV